MWAYIIIEIEIWSSLIKILCASFYDNLGLLLKKFRNVQISWNFYCFGISTIEPVNLLGV